MLSQNFLYGEKHIFTDNKNTTSTIKLQPGRNQTIEIVGPLNIIDGINGQSATITINGNPVTSAGSLATLSDVQLASLLNGQVIRYDSGDSKWKNITLSHTDISDFDAEVSALIAATNLDDLADVSYSGSVNNGQVLQWQGTGWRNHTLTSSDINNFDTSVNNLIASSNLNDLNDVVITTPTTGDALLYDGTNWINNEITFDFYNLENVDVNLGTLASGDNLRYNGTAWTNQTMVFDDLTNVDTSGKFNGAYVRYDGPSQTFVCEDIGFLNDLQDVSVADAVVGDLFIKKTDMGGDFWGRQDPATLTVGNATTADTADTTLAINTTTSSTNSNFYLTFVPSTGTTSSQTIYTDDTLKINPFSNTFTCEGNFNVIRNVATDATLYVYNSNNTASANAELEIQVLNTDADPRIRLITPGQTVQLYVDGSDSDKYKMKYDSGSDFLTVNTSGYINKPLQPNFRATFTAQQNNVTGNLTSYKCVFNDVSSTNTWNIGSHFDTTTGLFVVPINGLYTFNSAIFLSDLTSSHTSSSFLFFVEDSGGTTLFSSRFDISNVGAARDSSNRYLAHGTAMFQLVSGYKVGVQIVVGGGTLTVDILADNAGSFFSGALLY